MCGLWEWGPAATALGPEAGHQGNTPGLGATCGALATQGGTLGLGVVPWHVEWGEWRGRFPRSPAISHDGSLYHVFFYTT